MKVWKDLKILTTEHLSAIQERVDCMNPPPKVGRIPRKIQSGFASFTADEWKNWITLYSPFVLHSILPQTDFNCLCDFVEACQLLCQPILRKSQIVHAHQLILQFCITFEHLYGQEMCTPNMHMMKTFFSITVQYMAFGAFHSRGTTEYWKQ